MDLGAAGIEPAWLDTSFGKVEAWYIPPAAGVAGAPAPAVIFGHGNGELIDFWPEVLKRFSARWEWACCWWNTPATAGRPEAPPRRAYRRPSPGPTIRWRRARMSIPPASSFSGARWAAARCATSPQSDRRRRSFSCHASRVCASFAIRYLAPSFLIRDPFDNLAVVSDYSGPVLVIHGRFDEIIPFGHGKALHEAARNGKMIAYEAGHNDCPPDWAVFWRDAEEFLKANGGSAEADSIWERGGKTSALARGLIGLRAWSSSLVERRFRRMPPSRSFR